MRQNIPFFLLGCLTSVMLSGLQKLKVMLKTDPYIEFTKFFRSFWNWVVEKNLGVVEEGSRNL